MRIRRVTLEPWLLRAAAHPGRLRIQSCAIGVRVSTCSVFAFASLPLPFVPEVERSQIMAIMDVSLYLTITEL